jgi:hypothetical protein
MKLYKITDRNGQTYNETQWGEGIEHTASGEGDLCTSGWLHAYEDPVLAIVMNPVHANFKNPQLWEADGDVGITDGLKVGCTRLKTTKKIEIPEVSTTSKVAFGILCALEVYHSDDFKAWASAWLSGEDRTKKSATAAWAGAADEAWVEEEAAEGAAAEAAAAAWAEAAAAAWAEAEAARAEVEEAEAWAARAVAEAKAAMTAKSGAVIDFKALLKKAMEIANGKANTENNEILNRG